MDFHHKNTKAFIPREEEITFMFSLHSFSQIINIFFTSKYFTSCGFGQKLNMEQLVGASFSLPKKHTHSKIHTMFRHSLECE